MEKGNFAELKFRDVAEKLTFAKNFQINKEVVLELALKILILHRHILPWYWTEPQQNKT